MPQGKMMQPAELETPCVSVETFLPAVNVKNGIKD